MEHHFFPRRFRVCEFGALSDFTPNALSVLYEETIRRFPPGFPLMVNLWARWTSRSRMALATVVRKLRPLPPADALRAQRFLGGTSFVCVGRSILLVMSGIIFVGAPRTAA